MKIVKRLLIILPIALVVLIIGAVALVVVSVNSVAKAGIEKGGTYALGVKTTLGSASVGLLSGKFGLSKLEVTNPEGYGKPHFLTLGQGDVAVDYKTLQQDTVELPLLALSDITASLEKKEGKANYAVILDNVKKNTGSGGEPKPQPSGAKEKKFVIKDMSIKNVKVHLDMLGAGGLMSFDVPIDEIKLKNVGQTGTGVSGTGVTMGELAGIIVQAVLAAAVEKGGSIFPGDVLGDLQGSLASLGGLKDMGFEAVGEVAKLGEEAKKAAEGATKAIEGATKEAEKAVEGLKGLVPKKN